MLMPRPASNPLRHLVTLTVFFIFFAPLYWFFHTHRSKWSSTSVLSWIDPGQNVSGELTTIPTTLSFDEKTEFVNDAHKLPTADRFLSHFNAVLQLKRLTMEDAKSTCHWPEKVEVNFQYGPPADWVEHDRSDEELDFHRHEWQSFIKNDLLPYESYKHRFEGRGIVIVAGNPKSIKRVKVILNQLKRLKSTLPVEVHSWGNEISAESRDELSSVGVKLYFNDLSSPSNIITSNNDNFFHVNYQLKTAAVLSSSFAEPILLDSDNVPIIDPESLYDSDTYKDYGTIFWPDIARTRPNNPMWAITNTECRMDEYEQESGQMVVDKRRFWYHLQLAAWFNNVHATYYNEFLLGDKDMFRFAWHALKTPYGAPARWFTSVGATGLDGHYCGHTFAQHHPDPTNGTVAFLHGGLLKTIPRAVMQWYRDNTGGVFHGYKRSNVDSNPDFVERVGIKMEGNAWLPNRPEDLSVAWCTDMADIEPRGLDEIVPGFEGVFDELGGYWMLDE